MVLLLLYCAGCGGSTSGVTTFPLAGTVTFDAKPVPVGTVMLIPDASANNRGPGASVGIKNGAFATEPGKGHTGGKYIIQVTGFDGVPIPSGEGGMDPMGTQLFPPYDTKVDLPRSDHAITIDVPAAPGGAP
ncbi:MAG: hypothetical protein KJ000_31540 [Pirellulaceae bacterium]|nr:hypothetical protein [Pirellulaceae bacterium]